MTTTLPLRVWALLGHALQPLAPFWLRHRMARGKEDAERLAERLGIAGKPRPQGRLIWIHGASVGESLSVLPLVEKLMEDGFSVLVTSGTVASARLLAQRLPPPRNGQTAIHQFVPLDLPAAVARFLDHWRPEAGLFVESDLWPNLVGAARARGIKLALINARMSESSAQGWRRAPKTAAALLSAFDLCLAQDEEIAARFAGLGARGITVVGSLKADAPPLDVDEAALAALKAEIGARPLLLAAQTHPGEDETILPAHDALCEAFPNLLTIIVPRHVGRGQDIAMLCGPRPSARRSLGQAISSLTAVYIADTMGEMGLFYRLTPFCFLGGTLVPVGGHNPIEPAVLGCAVLAGPHRSSNTRAFDAILAAQGFGSVASSTDIAREAGRLLADPPTARAAGQAAHSGAVSLQGAVAKSAALLERLLGDARA
ncbi:MAG: 3-deoxy-D-manno-octulosonic acid transferase [Alphaproteobacteria bacterium]|nr:3-deoxy-D-manno-octulosonic acid transferase [Alphaproteobacteria bacterium]